MPFMPNPYFTAFSMPHMSANISEMNNLYAQQFPIHAPSYDACNHNVIHLAQKPTPKVKVDLNPPKPKVIKETKPKVVTNKNGPKTAWVPKST